MATAARVRVQELAPSVRQHGASARIRPMRESGRPVAAPDSARRLAPDRVRIVRTPQHRVAAPPVSLRRPFSNLEPAIAKGLASRVPSPARPASIRHARIANPTIRSAAPLSRRSATAVDIGSTTLSVEPAIPARAQVSAAATPIAPTSAEGPAMDAGVPARAAVARDRPATPEPAAHLPRRLPLVALAIAVTRPTEMDAATQ